MRIMENLHISTEKKKEPEKNNENFHIEQCY